MGDKTGNIIFIPNMAVGLQLCKTSISSGSQLEGSGCMDAISSLPTWPSEPSPGSQGC